MAILPVIQKPLLTQVGKYAVGATAFLLGMRSDELTQKAKAFFGGNESINGATTTTTPQPMLRRNNNGKLARNQRAVGVVASAFGKFAAKYTAWLAVMIGAGVTTSAAEQYFINHYQQKQIESLKRRSVDCTTNSFGCLNNRCWRNCGPRLTSSDWCITTNGDYKNNTKFDLKKNATITRKEWEAAACDHDDECTPCLQCQKSCVGDETFSPSMFSSIPLNVTEDTNKKLSTNTNVYASLREFP